MSDTNDATSDWDRVREEGERVSRDEAYQVLSAEIAALTTKNDRLREACRRLVEQDATLSACDDNVTVTVNAGLTTAEREAVEAAVDSFTAGADFNDQRGWPAMAERLRERAAMLRGLLSRTESLEVT